MDLGIEGKVALVLGGGGGLGGAVAHALAGEGANVGVADLNEAAASSVAEAISKAGGSAVALSWDIADPQALPANIATLQKAYGEVDILFNNSGGPHPGAIESFDPAVWTRSFESMVLSLMRVTAAVLPHMKQKKWGRIVTSTSSGVVAPIPNLGVSNALRLSLLGWSKTLSSEVAPHGVTVNIVVPGRIATGRTRFLDEQRAKREAQSVEAVMNKSAATIPVGRYGDPKEYANVVTFLASQAASYVTGAVVRVDGGLIQSV